MSSSSTFSSFIPSYSEEPFLSDLAAYERAIAQQNYAMMQGIYDKTQGVTDQVVNQALGNAGLLAGQAGQDFANYNQMFPGTIQSLDTEAKDFASTPRVQAEMGRAGATATQAGDAQRQAALRDLESFGVDPSSGRYAGLDTAERMQTAASAAGAQNQARVNTEQIGRALRSEELQNLARLPGQGIGEMSTANAAAGVGENAQLGASQTAGNLLGTPQTWAAIASGLKYPPLGQSGGSSRGAQSNSRGSGNNGSGNGSGGPSGNGGPSGSSWQPQGMSGGYDPALGMGGRGIGEGTTGGPQGAHIIAGPSGVLPDSTATDSTGSDLMGGADTGGMGGALEGGQGANASDWATAPDMNSMDFGGNGADSQFAVAPDMGNTMDFGGSGDPGQFAVAPDMSSMDFGGDGGGDNSGDFAEGGDVGDDDGDDGMGALPIANDATTGGKVPLSASPSLGRNTDDIRASLNAEEFVVPRDVARWKGEEFFQKLINASRQARAAASAKPQMKQPAQGPVRFATQRSPGANLGGAI